MLRVIVVLEFNGINDADSEKASNITDSITDECLILQHELSADACYVDDVVVEKNARYAVLALFGDDYQHGVVSTHDSKEEAELALFKCQEGDDKHDTSVYTIEEIY